MANDDLMNGVQTGQTIWNESHSVPGGKSRAIDLALFNGHIVYANGETGTYAGVDVIDTIEGKETFTANTTVLLADGSVSNQTFEGKATFKVGSDHIGGTGTWKLVNGTGRFAKLRGGGTFEWTVAGDKYRAEFSA